MCFIFQISTLVYPHFRDVGILTLIVIRKKSIQQNGTTNWNMIYFPHKIANSAKIARYINKQMCNFNKVAEEKEATALKTFPLLSKHLRFSWSTAMHGHSSCWNELGMKSQSFCCYFRPDHCVVWTDSRLSAHTIQVYMTGCKVRYTEYIPLKYLCECVCEYENKWTVKWKRGTNSLAWKEKMFGCC